jgi:hypothetical protein
MQQDKIQIPDNLKDIVLQKFIKLPLKNKLVIYAKFVHGNSFKPQNNDLFGLNRRSISKIYRSFIDSLKDINNVKNANSKSNKLKAKKSFPNKSTN